MKQLVMWIKLILLLSHFLQLLKLLMLVERPRFIFEEEGLTENQPKNVLKKMLYQTEANHQYEIQLEGKGKLETQPPEQGGSLAQKTASKPQQTSGLKYNKLQQHILTLSNTTDSQLPQMTGSAIQYEDKMNSHLEEAKEMKPNLFFREDNRSPVPQADKTLKIEPVIQQTPFDPYKYIGHGRQSRSTKKEYQIILNNKANPKNSKIEGDTKSGEISFEISNNSSQLVLQVAEDRQANQQENQHHKKQIEQILSCTPAGVTHNFNFTIQKEFGVNYLHPEFKIWSAEGKVLVSAKKQALNFNSYYNIFVGDIKSDRKLGFLRGNFGGTEFNIYQSQEGFQELQATVAYRAEISCNAYRKMELYVKNPKSENKDIFSGKCKNLRELYEQEGNTMDILKIVTKEPVWSKHQQAYVMNFKGKSRLSSTKNTILIDPSSQGENILLFCKRSYNKFYLQVSFPLNLLVCMGVLLTSFDFKLLCQ